MGSLDSKSKHSQDYLKSGIMHANKHSLVQHERGYSFAQREEVTVHDLHLRSQHNILAWQRPVHSPTFLLHGTVIRFTGTGIRCGVTTIRYSRTGIRFSFHRIPVTHGEQEVEGLKGPAEWLTRIRCFPGNAVKSGHKAKKVTTPISYQD